MKVYMAGFEKMIRERIQTANMLSSIIFAVINEPPAAWRLIRKAILARGTYIYRYRVGGRRTWPYRSVIAKRRLSGHGFG